MLHKQVWIIALIWCLMTIDEWASDPVAHSLWGTRRAGPAAVGGKAVPRNVIITAHDLADRLAEGWPLLAIVRGTRGSGRSTVLSELAATCAAQGVAVMRARCHADESDVENGVVHQLLDDSDTAGVTTDHTVSTDVLHLSTPRDDDATPVAIIVDDINYADRSSFIALTYLARRLDGRPIRMFLTVDQQDYRTPALMAELTRLPYTRVHTLAPLSAGEEAGTLAKAVGRNLSPDTVDIVRRTTRGNPQVAVMAGLELATRLLSADETPETVHECCALATWHTRLQWVEKSHPNAANLYRALLILGRDADLIGAAALCDLPAGVAHDAQQVLVDFGLLTGDPLQPLKEHREHHYARLNPQRTVDMHRRAADLAHRGGMSARTGASHLMRSNQKLCEDDLVLLRRAANEAALTGDWATAQGTLRHALSQCHDAPTSHRLLLDLHHVHLRSDVRACSQSTLALSRTGVPNEVMARELASLSHLLLAASFTPVSTVLKGLADEMDVSAPTTPPSLVAQAHLLRHASPRRRLALAAVSDPAVLTARALLLAASGHHRDRCRHLLERVVPDPTSLAHRDPMLIGLAALTATWTEDLSVAQFWATEGATAARADHRPVEEAVNMLVRALSADRIGQPHAALADAEAARKLFQAINADAFAEFARAVHAEACIQVGQIDRAIASLDGLRPRGDAHPLLSATVAHALGRLAEARGDAAGALGHLLSCPRYLQAVGITGPSVLTWHPAMIRVLAQSAREDASRLVAEGFLASARTWAAPGIIGQALHARAASASGLDRIRYLRAAEEQLAQSGLERARHTVLTELAASYAKHGDADAEQWALTEVENTRASCTSETVQDDAECSTVQLSRAEQRVVDLVLEGHSNAHVAGKLFLSKRTVDTHLGRIYKKLGISSRTQLAAALGDGAS